jgi:Domain of unknown function (DUF4178)
VTRELAIGARGKYRGERFIVRGKMGLKHSSGAVWEEWCARFEGGRYGWIAEVDGAVFVTFEVAWPPEFSSLHEGDALLPAFVVVETGRARYHTAEGKLPFDPPLGESYRYADLEAATGELGTLDFSEDPPLLFIGQRTTMDELHLDPPRRKSS